MATTDLLSAFAAEQVAAAKAAKDTGLMPKAFAAFGSLRNSPNSNGLDPLELGSGARSADHRGSSVAPATAVRNEWNRSEGENGAGRR